MNATACLKLVLPVVLLASACRSRSQAGTDPASVPPPPSTDSGSTPPSGTTPTGSARPETGGLETTAGDPRQLRYRFDMEQPANEDFAFKDDQIFIYIRPFEQVLSIKVQGREQNHIKILWNESEFVDIIGRRYRLVPPTISVQDAAFGIIPPTDVPPGQIFTGEVVLLDPADIQTIRALGGKNTPIVPVDAGTPEQIREREFTMRLAIELNYARRDYDFIFSIQDVYYR
jgi:hypothetical protein